MELILHILSFNESPFLQIYFSITKYISDSRYIKKALEPLVMFTTEIFFHAVNIFSELFIIVSVRYWFLILVRQENHDDSTYNLLRKKIMVDFASLIMLDLLREWNIQHGLISVLVFLICLRMDWHGFSQIVWVHAIPFVQYIEFTTNLLIQLYLLSFEVKMWFFFYK